MVKYISVLDKIRAGFAPNKGNVSLVTQLCPTTATTAAVTDLAAVKLCHRSIGTTTWFGVIAIYWMNVFRCNSISRADNVREEPKPIRAES